MGWLRLTRPLLVMTIALIAGAFAAASPAQAGPIAWCGTGEPATDLPDALGAFEWHVIYAIPTDGQDRFGYFAPRIAGDVAAVSNWWVGQDPTRRPRYDLIDAPGCPSESQRVDITVAHLPHTNAAESGGQIEDDLQAQGFASVDKGYLVYYEGSLNVADEYGVCGQGGVADGPWAYSIIYLQACFQATSDDYRSITVAHEMTHGMGAVHSQAPHYCNSGHVCDSPSDLMKAAIHDGDSLAGLTLDVGRDDYYGHSGSWFDVQDCGLLYRLDLTLPAAPALTATATSVGNAVTVTLAAHPFEFGIRFRVYGADGQVAQDGVSSTLSTTADVGQTLQWTARTEDEGGFLGTPATLRFKVGYGLVDASGVVTKDTVSPGAVGNLRQTRAGKSLVVRWAAVADPIGLRGYRVTAPGLTPLIVKSPTVTLPRAKVHGKKITVVAVDRAGNIGSGAAIVARS
jgi:hypothetical protein